jgi:hypothetical protein
VSETNLHQRVPSKLDVFIVVTYEQTSGVYRLFAYSEQSVPAYGPALAANNKFTDVNVLREFLLTKG